MTFSYPTLLQSSLTQNYDLIKPNLYTCTVLRIIEFKFHKDLSIRKKNNYYTVSTDRSKTYIVIRSQNVGSRLQIIEN